MLNLLISVLLESNYQLHTYVTPRVGMYGKRLVGSKKGALNMERPSGKKYFISSSGKLYLYNYLKKFFKVKEPKEE